VPEISLTPQTVERFISRFGDRVAVVHSALTGSRRFGEWKKIKEGKAKIVVGARSAVFSPMEDIGLIIVDEEHETSYKQDDVPRYHARDVALERARANNCPLILGSATPSLESYHNARNGRYAILELTKRVEDASLPKVKIVDMRMELAARRRINAVKKHSGRGAGFNLAMEGTTWHTQIHVPNANLGNYTSSPQITGFYQENTNDTALGKYFGFNNQRNLIIGNAGTSGVDIDKRHLLHDHLGIRNQSGSNGFGASLLEGNNPDYFWDDVRGNLIVTTGELIGVLAAGHFYNLYAAPVERNAQTGFIESRRMPTRVEAYGLLQLAGLVGPEAFVWATANALAVDWGSRWRSSGRGRSDLTRR